MFIKLELPKQLIYGLILLFKCVNSGSTCLKTAVGYGASISANIAYDDTNALINGYKLGMIISGAKFCNIVGTDGNKYLVGTQYTLKNFSTQKSVQLSYNGKDPNSWKAADQYSCVDNLISESITKWYLGKRTYLSSTTQYVIDAIVFQTTSKTNFSNNYTFAQINGGFQSGTVSVLPPLPLIGSYGTYSASTGVFDSVNWITWDKASCICDTTQFLPATMTNMIASTQGESVTSATPKFITQYENFEMGGDCGEYTVAMSAVNGNNVSAFINLSGTINLARSTTTTITLKATDLLQNGNYNMQLKATLNKYTTISTTSLFTATLELITVITNWQSIYNQEYGKPQLVIVPQCMANPISTGSSFQFTYMIENQNQLPSYLIVDSVKSTITLPNQDIVDAVKSFTVTFSCQIPAETSISKYVFQATGSILPCTTQTCPVATPTWQASTCSCVCNKPTCNTVALPTFDSTTCSCVCNQPATCPAATPTFQQSTCSCVCNITTCTTPQILNTNSCSCNCPSQPTCPSGQIFDPIKCTCSCPTTTITCTSPQVFNTLTCACDCGAMTCASPQILKLSNCTCGCDTANCASPQILNTSTCACSCPAITCASPQILNTSTCACNCPATSCASPQVLNTSTCACSCPASTCASPQVLNTSTCACNCPATICASPQVLNTSTCACGCPAITCISPQILNTLTCACNCPATTCLSPQVLNTSTCVCGCGTTSCFSPQVLNSSTCNCDCGTTTCASPQVLNTQTCTCGCVTNTCTLPQVLNTQACTCGCSQTICASPQILNTLSCTCVCPSTTCPVGQTQDPILCICGCGTISCTFPQVLNASTCTCGCGSTTCISPQILHTSTCTCGCSAITCASEQTLDPIQCACVCITKTCPLGQSINTTSCACQCDNSCPSGTILNSQDCTCNSTCTLTCTTPQILDSTLCTCGCPTTIICTSPMILQTSTCTCGCPSHTCPTGQTINQNTCTCQCSNTQCNSPYFLNTTTCNCYCSITTCTQPQVLNALSCSCGCSTTSCLSPQVLSSSTCTCSCPANLSCSNGQILDPIQCTCGCGSTTCTSPQVLNASTCTCGCPQTACNFPQILDMSTCTCKCPATTICTSPQILNPSTCTCSCPTTTCPTGQSLDTTKCICGCGSQTCPLGQNLNVNNCQCECSNTCQTGNILNPNDCTCNSSCTLNCNFPKLLNQSSCTCDCSSSTVCTPPQVLNQLTCTCGCPSTTCISPLLLNSQTCYCDCSSSTVCFPPQVLNQLTCTCGCSSTICISPLFFDSQTCTCDCSSTTICTLPQVLNQLTCTCSCPTTTICQNNQTFDDEDCICVCENTCPQNQIMNDMCQCICVQIQCPSYWQIWSDDSCSCICNQPPICPFSTPNWDNNSCTCTSAAKSGSNINMINFSATNLTINGTKITPYKSKLYYLPTGKGPFLLNKYQAFDGKNITTSFQINLNKGMDWVYKFGNNQGNDTFQYQILNQTTYLPNFYVKVFLGIASTFIEYDITNSTNEIEIHTINKGYWDPSLAGNYTIMIQVVNILGQVNTTNITIELLPFTESVPVLTVQEQLVTQNVSQQQNILFSPDGIIRVYFTKNPFVSAYNGKRNLQAIQKQDNTQFYRQYKSLQVSLNQSNVNSVVQQTSSEQENFFKVLLQLNSTVDPNDSQNMKYTYNIKQYNKDYMDIVISFYCPSCISSESQDTMLVTCYLNDQFYFSQSVSIPPQANQLKALGYSIIWIASLTITCIMGLSFILSFCVNFIAGTILRRRIKDKPQFRELWQTWEIWQMVCYLHLLGSPISGNSLFFIKPMMMLVNFDFLNCFPKLKFQWEKIFTGKKEKTGNLGPNFVPLNIDSYYFMKNTGSLMALFWPLFLIMFILSISSLAIRSIRQQCNQDDWYILLKSVLMMKFGISGLIMVLYLPENGYQTALALLSIAFLFLIVPVYALIRTILLKKLPGRQLISSLQRILTCFAIVCLRRWPSYQVFALYFIQMLTLIVLYPWSFTACMRAKKEFQKKQSDQSQEDDSEQDDNKETNSCYCYYKASSLSYSWSFQLVQALMPLLVIFIRFDSSGSGTVVMSAFIFLFTSIKNLIIDDVVYKIRLLTIRVANIHKKVTVQPEIQSKLISEELPQPVIKRTLSRFRKPWFQNDHLHISEEDSQSKTESDQLRKYPDTNKIFLDDVFSDEKQSQEHDRVGNTEFTQTNIIDTQGILISQGDEEDPHFDGQWRVAPFTVINSGKKVRTNQISALDKELIIKQQQSSYSSEEDSKVNSKVNIRNINSQQNGQNNNLIIERDGQNLGDLNFKGPIKNISLNENRELEISFGVQYYGNQLNSQENKIYDSELMQKDEIIKVPLWGGDSDESIEVNIDIDWPKRSVEEMKQAPKSEESEKNSPKEQPNLVQLMNQLVSEHTTQNQQPKAYLSRIEEETKHSNSLKGFIVQSPRGQDMKSSIYKLSELNYEEANSREKFNALQTLTLLHIQAQNDGSSSVNSPRENTFMQEIMPQSARNYHQYDLDKSEKRREENGSIKTDQQSITSPKSNQRSQTVLTTGMNSIHCSNQIKSSIQSSNYIKKQRQTSLPDQVRQTQSARNSPKQAIWGRARSKAGLDPRIPIMSSSMPESPNSSAIKSRNAKFSFKSSTNSPESQFNIAQSPFQSSSYHLPSDN